MVMNITFSKATAALILSSLFVRQHAVAFPIEPVGLRDLIERSDLIVFANVQPPPLALRRPGIIDVSDLWAKSPARLRTITVIKGKAPDGLISVYFQEGLVCPAPPRFPPGTNVLAFLRLDPESDGFQTVALSYGAKVMSHETVEAYIRHIQDYLAATRGRVGSAKTARITEWLVECAEDPLARWEGTFDLCERLTLWGQIKKSDFARMLTTAQTARLSNVLFKAEFITSGEIPLIDLFKTKAKAPLAKCLIRYLRKAGQPYPSTGWYKQLPDYDDFPEPWCLFDVMRKSAEWIDSPEALALVRELNWGSFFSATARIKAARNFLPIFEKAAVDRGYLKRGEIREQ